MNTVRDPYAISRDELHILRHAIGIDDAGQDRYPNARSDDERRNYYVTAAESPDGQRCQRLVVFGWMRDAGRHCMMPGDHYYIVTDAGKAVVRLHKPAPPRLTRSQRRYREFLDSASGILKFGEWLKLKSREP